MSGYGIPYMGSKNSIAKDICEYIVNRHYDRDIFIDACCGGLAITHYLLKHTNLKVMANDLDSNLIEFYKEYLFDPVKRKKLDAEFGYKFIDRETYKERVKVAKGSERVFLISCWTFGNANNENHMQYLYGEEIELQKELMSNLLFYGNTDNVSNYYKKKIVNADEKIKGDIDEIMNWYNNKLSSEVKAMNYFENQNKRSLFLTSFKKYIDANKGRLAQLERLQRLAQLELYNKDVIEFISNLPSEILDRAIIYIDPPYKDTAGYNKGASNLNEQIRELAIKLKDRVPIYISEYQLYDGLEQCYYRDKISLLCKEVNKGNRTVKQELLMYNGYNRVNKCMGDLLGIWG